MFLLLLATVLSHPKVGREITFLSSLSAQIPLWYTDHPPDLHYGDVLPDPLVE